VLDTKKLQARLPGRTRCSIDDKSAGGAAPVWESDLTDGDGLSKGIFKIGKLSAGWHTDAVSADSGYSGDAACPVILCCWRWRMTGVAVMPWSTMEARTTNPTTANRTAASTSNSAVL
jgi:hypothetical protein